MDGFRAILSRLLVLSLFLDPEDLSLSWPELPESLIGLFLDLLPGNVPPIGLLENNKTIINKKRRAQLQPTYTLKQISLFSFSERSHSYASEVFFVTPPTCQIF